MAKPTDKGGAPVPVPLYPELSIEPPPEPLSARMPRDPAAWVAHIRDREMPAVGATVALVHNVTEDELSTTDRLAQVILQDAAMTTKVLKLANSAFYNPTRQQISTVSRAIIVLGFNVVAEIAVGIRVVDAVLAGGVRQRVLEEMARCFHAAVQARAIANLRRDGRSEEVFIAALLSRVGEMAFWCFGGQAALRLDEMMKRSEQNAEDMQMAVLGFKLKQLSLGLAREWKLGSLLQSVLSGSTRQTPVEQAISYGRRLAIALEAGWETPEMAQLLADLSAFLGMSREALQAEVIANSEEAARIATYYGAGEAARHIPQARPVVIEAEAAPADEPAPSHGPDPHLQLRILRELSGRIAMKASLNETLQLVLEGIYRGVGFDRVLFALLSANGQQLIGKTGLGVGIEALRQRFIFSLDKAPGDLLNEVLREPRALRFDARHPLANLRADRLQLVTNSDCACVAPIMAQGRAIGIFYADRRDSLDGIDDETFEAFQLFVQQVSLAVTASAKSARSP